MDIGVIPLSEAWRFVSVIQAQIMCLPDRGEIAQGRRADQTINNANTRAVEAAFSGGFIVFLSGEAAMRSIGIRRYFQNLAAEQRSTTLPQATDLDQSRPPLKRASLDKSFS
ncbi:MAG: hypothetical protein AAGF94_07305 [Pseudomonadota bacterium]